MLVVNPKGGRQDHGGQLALALELKGGTRWIRSTLALLIPRMIGSLSPVHMVWLAQFGGATLGGSVSRA